MASFRSYRRTGPACLLVLLGLCASAGAVEFAGGTGEPNDPYQIATAEQLVTIGSDPNLLSKHFILTVDINLAAIAPQGLSPIGAAEPGFTGVFDGQHHTISHFRYSTSLQQYAGLFGIVTGSGRVENLHLLDIDVSGQKTVGGLAAYNSGTIESCTIAGTAKVSNLRFSGRTGGLVGANRGRIVNCSVVAQVQGTNPVGGLVGYCEGGQIVQCSVAGSVQGADMVGGLVGQLDVRSGTAIQSCYSLVEVRGGGCLGGLVGWANRGLVSTSYFAGKIVETQTKGYTAEKHFGGLIGRKESASIFLCYWNAGAYEAPIGDASLSRTSAELMTRATFRGWGWDGAWVLADDADYPRLAWQGTSGTLIVDDPCRYAGGSGEPNDPYRIATAEQLSNIGYHRSDFDKHFVLTNDIDLNILPEGAVMPIGRCGLPFTGSFNGAGNAIRHLRIVWPEVDCVGLFGYIETSGTDSGLRTGRVECLRVTDANVVGRNVIGVLAGRTTGAVASCDIAGSVTGNDIVGGLVGSNQDLVYQCYAHADVNAATSAGGVVGWNEGVIDQCGCQVDVRAGYASGGLAGQSDGTIVNSFATGSVTGDNESWNLGGLVGVNAGGTVSRCCATMTVVGDWNLGGLVGETWGCVITDCYTLGSVYGSDSVGGLAGDLIGEGIVDRCYAATCVRGSRDVGGLVGRAGSYASSVKNSYFLRAEDSGGPDSEVGKALTADEMRQLSSFVGWDFVNTWSICEGRDYPRLRWENVDCNNVSSGM